MGTVRAQPPPVRVLYIQHAREIGGSAISLQLLVRTALRWESYQLEPHVLLPVGASSQLVAMYEAEGARVSLGHRSIVDGTIAAARRRNRLRARADRALQRRGRSLGSVIDALETVRPDVVHLNSATLAPAAEYLISAGVPFVWHVREPPNPRGGSTTTWIANVMSHAPAVVFLSEYDRESWLLGKKPQGRTFVVPNAVDLSLFHPEPDVRHGVRRRLGIERDSPVVLYAGGLVEIKGSRQLLAACAQVRRAYPAVRFLMPGAAYAPAGGLVAAGVRRSLTLAGRPTIGDQLRALLRECGPACLPLPLTPDINSLFAAADVVAFPSLVPHFARPVIEAMAAGCSVVASDLPGVRELARSFPSEMITMVPAGNVDALARALVDRLASRPDESSIEQARRRSAELYGLESHGEAIIAIYEQVLSSG